MNTQVESSIKKHKVHYPNSVIHKLVIYWVHNELCAVICESPFTTERLRAVGAPLFCWVLVIVMYVWNKSDLLHYLVLSGGAFSFFFSLPSEAKHQQSFTVCCWTNGIEAVHHGRLTSISRLSVTPTSHSSILYCCTKYISPLKQTAALCLGCLTCMFMGWESKPNPDNIEEKSYIRL